MGSHHCPSCNRSFETRRGLGVHHVHAHDERLTNRTCEHCGESFYSDYEKKYCSRSCLRDSGAYAGESNPNYQGGKTKATCKLCGTEFRFYPSEKEGIFCSDCVESETWQTPPGLTGSDHPRWRDRISRDCAVCGTKIERTPGLFTTDDVVCSKSCHNQWLSEAFSGDGHPNWKGGGSRYYGKGWRRARFAALRRDNFACRVCGETADEIGRNPDVHHIVPVRIYDESSETQIEDAHRLDNLIALCVTCHRNADIGNIPASTLQTLIDETVPSE